MPPPQHLALAATLAVHPSTTTRAPSKDRLHAANAALVLLRTTNGLIGPKNANFAAAFAFAPAGNRRKNASNRRRNERPGSPDSEDDGDLVGTHIANAGSLWTLAEDFWHVAGWAFNCSVAYPARWARWKLWLGVLLDVLEADWEEREARARLLGPGNASGEEASMILRGSIVAQYLPTEISRYGGSRRVLRAMFADGSSKSMAEFKEIFRDETKELKAGSGLKRKREAGFNVDEFAFGDYGEDEESILDMSTQSSEQYQGISSAGSDEDANDHSHIDTTGIPDGSSDYGGMDSLLLRQRIFSLASGQSLLLTIANRRGSYHASPNSSPTTLSLWNLCTVRT